MTLANLVTFLRILLVPLFAFLFFSSQGSSQLLVAAVFVTTGLTDVLDGYLARSRHEVSTLGTLLDPLADKLMTLTAVFSLIVIGRMPVWVGVVLLVKELALVVGATVFYVSKDQVVAASFLGKAATFLLYFGITALILQVQVGLWFVAAGVVLSVVAGIDYLRRAVRPR